MLSGDTCVPFGDRSVLYEVTRLEASARIWVDRAPLLDTPEHDLDIDYWSGLDAELLDCLSQTFEASQCLLCLCLLRLIAAAISPVSASKAERPGILYETSRSDLMLWQGLEVSLEWVALSGAGSDT